MNTATDILAKNQLSNTDWGARIIDAEKRGHFTASDAQLARGWCTCACGKNEKVQSLANEYAICEHDEPRDDELRRLGVDFYRLIACARNEYVGNKERIVDAALTLVSIEERATVLIKNGAELK